MVRKSGAVLGRSRKQKKRLGEFLVESGLIKPDQLVDCLRESKRKHKKLGEILLEKKIISEERLLVTLSRHLGIEYLKLEEISVEPEAILMVPEHLAKKHRIVPVSFRSGSLVIAMSDPLEYGSISDIRFYTGSDVKPVLSSANDISEAIDRLYSNSSNIEEMINETVNEFETNTFNAIPEISLADDSSISIEERTRLAPIIRLTNLILSNAVKKGASDIHIEPELNNFRVRYRVDGILKEDMKLPKWAQGAVVSRIKILAKLDITERRIPQDGGIRIVMNQQSIDLRISSLPTNYGEKVVIRILARSQIITTLESLGFFEREIEQVNHLISRRKGLIIVTGPTGSGKTTTLYSVLSMLKSETRNIVTVENPIEYNMPGITQVQINSEVGLTFGAALRSILRQDPDIILVGEIRDAETAHLAVRAAMTGHLVLSTMHTNDAVSTISRMRDLDLPNFLISSLLVGVIAQRLVRRICPKCKEFDLELSNNLSPEIKAFGLTEESIKGKSFFRGQGCIACDSSGYKGRVSINEIMIPDQRIKELIIESTSEPELAIAAAEAGMKTLAWNGLQKSLAGLTTIEEVTRVVEISSEHSTCCKSCGQLIRSTFHSCPYCGKLCGSACANCGKGLEEEWQYCPFCTNPVTPTL